MRRDASVQKQFAQRVKYVGVSAVDSAEDTVAAIADATTTAAAVAVVSVVVVVVVAVTDAALTI